MKILLFVFLSTPMLAIAQENESKFSNESKVSIIQTGGNSVIETYDLKTENTYVTGKEEFKIGGHYILGESEVTEDGTTTKEETARNWDIHFKYSHELSKIWRMFSSINIESDKFAGYEKRNNLDFGAHRDFYKEEKFTFFTEFGLRYTEEFLSEGENKDGESGPFKDFKGRVYLEMDKKPAKNYSYKLWVEYIPNFTRAEDYLINIEPSLVSGMTDIFSIQLAYKLMYDNLPAKEGNKYVDYTFTTSLLAKF